MSKSENQELLFRAITHKPQDCIECELAVVVNNTDPEEYEDGLIRVCPVMGSRADEIDMKDCPLPMTLTWYRPEEEKITEPKYSKIDIAILLRQQAREVGETGTVSMNRDMAMLIAQYLEE